MRHGAPSARVIPIGALIVEQVNILWRNHNRRAAGAHSAFGAGQIAQLAPADHFGLKIARPGCSAPELAIDDQTRAMKFDAVAGKAHDPLHAQFVFVSLATQGYDLAAPDLFARAPCSRPGNRPAKLSAAWPPRHHVSSKRKERIKMARRRMTPKDCSEYRSKNPLWSH